MFSCVAVSCGYGTCFAVRACDELYHFIFSIDHVGIPFGFQMIIWTLARHLRVYMGCALAVVFQACSLYVPLTNGPLFRVRFGEFLVVRLYSEIDHIHLGIEA